MSEKEHLVRLIDNLRHSRKISIEKMISIIDKMSEKALWLTYRKTEQVSDVMTTPRGSNPRNSNSYSGTKHIFLKRKSNPLAQSAGRSYEKNNFLSASKNTPFERAHEMRATYDYSKLSPRLGDTTGSRMHTMPNS